MSNKDRALRRVGGQDALPPKGTTAYAEAGPMPCSLRVGDAAASAAGQLTWSKCVTR